MSDETMNTYDVIMRAAAHIEQNPQLFDYHKIYVPSCGTPGCALGWIGFFARAKDPLRTDGFTNVGYTAKSVLGCEASEFYLFMQDAVPGWTKSAALCAKGMRLYAEKHHKPAQSTPDWLALASKQMVPEGSIRSPEYVGFVS
ncbi:MAG TPA: hypothetical protein VFS24_07455 [Steroidobacteraceae bacterium]|nr:hypothetical protein [Steroidobacteraceae bacterium]